MQHLIDTLDRLEKEVNDALKFIDIPHLEKQVADFEEQMNHPEFWNDSTKAQRVSKEHGSLKQKIEDWRSLEQGVKDSKELIGMVNEVTEEDEFHELEQSTNDLEKRFQKLEVQLYLGGKYDNRPALVSIHAGAGGTDAQDWAEMLLRMYTRYAEGKGWSVEITDRSDGDEAGIKSTTVRIDGDYTYGFLKEESGVHRLVRISPFNSGGTRETSFAKVEVIPEIDHSEVTIDESDLRIDVFRASGHGGQGVNTTDSAVRITHEPTGIVVQCQNERSQLQNKQQAMNALMSKLIALQEKHQLQELNQIKGDHVETAWGNQIRSYVLHPYQMVKDHRTEHETNQVDKVIEGDVNELDVFIERSLKQAKGSK
jgi:peptide chain release factor 2